MPLTTSSGLSGTTEGWILRLEDYDEDLDEIYVLDTETTGLDGGPKDSVVDIGICVVDLNRRTVKDVYSSIVGHDVSSWDDAHRNAWIFENTDLELDMVADAPPLDRVRSDVAGLLTGRMVTSYNVPFDLNKFLYREPWGMCGTFRECTDIMKAATAVCRIPGMYYGSYRFPKLDYAYETIVEDDPAGIHGKQDHRALSDARMASHLMIRMFRNGDYRP